MLKKSSRVSTALFSMLIACSSVQAQLASASLQTEGRQADREERAAAVRKIAIAEEARLIAIFKHIHANPELGFEEKATSALISTHLRDLGYEVHTGIGKTGVVAILRNGPGPVVMFRSDMDALPIKEVTQLSYRSTVVIRGSDGRETPVSHACGHDMHVAWLLGVAKAMASLKRQWSGTLVLVAQPAEELGLGAMAMVRDGLYNVTPKPDVLIAAHVFASAPPGIVAISPGRRMAGSDSIEVVIHGEGSHASSPQSAKDPVVMGAQAILAYQTIISRELDPQEPAVLTVGAFQAGSVSNIIPSTAVLKINLRWFDAGVRDMLIQSIKRKTDAVAVAAGVAADKMPSYRMTSHVDPITNDVGAVDRAMPALRAAVGPENIQFGSKALMTSEDFAALASPFPDTRILYLGIGGGSPNVREDMRRGIIPPINHNPGFRVDPAAIKPAVEINTMAIMEFLQPEKIDHRNSGH